MREPRVGSPEIRREGRKESRKGSKKLEIGIHASEITFPFLERAIKPFNGYSKRKRINIQIYFPELESWKLERLQRRRNFQSSRSLSTNLTNGVNFPSRREEEKEEVLVGVSKGRWLGARCGSTPRSTKIESKKGRSGRILESGFLSHSPRTSHTAPFFTWRLHKISPGICQLFITGNWQISGHASRF